MIRPIIEIDEELCNGCGQCILDCAEGALALVDGKARLISDVYCDGLGACLNCPQGALRLREREAPAFDEAAALAAKAGREAGTPAMPARAMREILARDQCLHELDQSLKSGLRSWPVQLLLMPPAADYYSDADILLSAQCAGFALPNIGRDWLAGRLPIIACPKLEDNEKLTDRLAAILAGNQIRKLTILRMSVPCCGLERIARAAIEKAGASLPWEVHVVKP